MGPMECGWRNGTDGRRLLLFQLDNIYILYSYVNISMKIGERGQVTIPKHIREQYGLLSNIEVDFIETENGVLLKKSTTGNPVRKIYGVLKNPSSTDDYIEAVRGK